jgi:hypothetical protein
MYALYMLKGESLYMHSLLLNAFHIQFVDKICLKPLQAMHSSCQIEVELVSLDMQITILKVL